MRAAIRGAGVVGAFGCGLARLAEAVGRLPAAGAGSGAGLTAETDVLDRLIPPRTLRRVEHYGRMAILAAHLAIEDAGLSGAVPGDTGLVVATGMGPTANTLDRQPVDIPLADLALSPILFSNSVQNAAAAHISMLLGMRGPSLSINQYELGVPLAFQAALDWLEEGRTGTVLVGCVDGFSTALHEEALRCGGADAVPVGEGSAFFVLTAVDADSGAHPVVEEVRTGGPGRVDSGGIADALVLRNGVRPPDAPGDERCLSGVYGSFPTSMGMDVAAAVILLRAGGLPGIQWPAAGRRGRVCCLKEGESGDWGAVVLGRGYGLKSDTRYWMLDSG
jgi:3-oxoacyl-[acyl-carrier-protein] synthase II